MSAHARHVAPVLGEDERESIAVRDAIGVVAEDVAAIDAANDDVMESRRDGRVEVVAAGSSVLGRPGSFAICTAPQRGATVNVRTPKT